MSADLSRDHYGQRWKQEMQNRETFKWAAYFF